MGGRWSILQRNRVLAAVNSGQQVAPGGAVSFDTGQSAVVLGAAAARSGPVPSGGQVHRRAKYSRAGVSSAGAAAARMPTARSAVALGRGGRLAGAGGGVVERSAPRASIKPASASHRRAPGRSV